MARRSSQKATEEVANTEQPQEAAVSTTETEAPEAPTAEATEAPIDLTAFEAAATAAVAEADTSTGTVPDAEVAKVVTEYRNLDGIKPKNKAKAHLNESMKDAMNADDLVKARAYLQLHESMTAGSGGGSTKEKAPADPTEAFVQRSATLALATYLLTPGEGVGEDWETKRDELVSSSQSQAEQYLAYVQDESEDKGDEPEVSPVVRNAVKLAVGKSAKVGGRSGGGSFDGPRRDIGNHILSAFADQPIGTFLTVAEIRKHQSEEYGTDSPSAGAISARLFPASGKCSLVEKGIQPDTNEKGNKGARKTA